MASTKSLGIHKPSALPFLVSEGILPSDPTEDAYNWQTFQHHGQGQAAEETEEELITTEHCVVWSRGGILKRIFRFDIEKEAVTQAVFSNFDFQTLNAETSRRPSPLERKIRSDDDAGGLQNKESRGAAPRPRSRAGFVGRAGSNPETPTEVGVHEEPASHRALVVLLKTQAHVFLISGISHVVHLPFEVDSVFPSFRGLLLQRKLTEHPISLPTPVLPSAPQNTFSYSQSSIQNTVESHSLHDNPDHGVNMNDWNSPFVPLLQKLQLGQPKPVNVELPRLFCLVDPLSEVGTVVTTDTSRTKNSLDSRRFQSSPFASLDSDETMLYISPDDELVHSNMSSAKSRPLILAVTINHASQTTSLWTISYVNEDPERRSKSLPRKTFSGHVSNRRNSIVTRLSTGATTPVAKSHRYSSRDPNFEDENSQEQESLLDSALGNPAVPAKSSRRVSSLLARSDLSTTHDKITFTDLAAGYHGARNSRHGPSFGTRNSQLANDADSSMNPAKSRPYQDIRSSFDSVSLHNQPLGDAMNDVDDIHELKSMDGDPGFKDTMQGLRKEIIFRKIYSVSNQGTRHRRSLRHDSKSKPHVFTMQTPSSNGSGLSSSKTIILCVMNCLDEELLILQINATPSRDTDRSRLNALPDSLDYDIRVVGTRRSGVMDACRVGHGLINRILVLDGKGNSLTLQAPWTTLIRIKLPTPLLLYDTHRIREQSSPQQKREGGLNRIISQGPKVFKALQHATRYGCVDVVDSTGINHRIQIKLSPSNTLVSRMIRVCEAVLPASDADGEAIIRGWWDTMAWLGTRSDKEIDMEWTAMLVVLFSMGIMFMDDPRTEITPRQKKRKGGPLRSSSGANTDLDSWDAMLRIESGSSSMSPEWMRHGAWKWTGEECALPSAPSQGSRPSQRAFIAPAVPIPSKSSHVLHCVSLAREFVKSPAGQAAIGRQGYLPTASSKDPDLHRTALASVLVALHLLREELKLDTLAAQSLHQITPVLAQIGGWLGWQNWSWEESSYYMHESTEMAAWLFDDMVITKVEVPPEPFLPPSILGFIEATHTDAEGPAFTSLLDVLGSPVTSTEDSYAPPTDLLLELTPRTFMITKLLVSHTKQTGADRVSKMSAWDLNPNMLETLPESVAAPFRTAMAACQAQPSTAWKSDQLQMIGRDDIVMLERDEKPNYARGKMLPTPSTGTTRDVHSICTSALDVETVGPYDGSAEIDRQIVTRLLFEEDQRFAEAAKLVHPLHYPIARCVPEPGWSEQEFLEAQQELAKLVALRTLSVSLGRGLLFYGARLPLLTEKFPVHGFTLSCIMKPSDTTVTADRVEFTEEKVSWAFFHAGVEAGLSISKDAKGIDTSWILFNKPRDLTNRHAGFLLALGLNGHLKSIAKWLAFKYLTPKHNMTSIGLLLGLAASHLGTMDTLVTRLLSVHVTRMLPPGAAELNLSPLTQTSGMMGIGLLYCNTQHRRMSEIMLSEMENIDQEDSSNPSDTLRDEGYRLAAGFAFGYINLGSGRDLKGLHDMHITERLLSLAVSTKRVDFVHTADKATAGATIALALVFMKTNDEPLARKIDVPDTVHQFDYIRPDQFLLRTVTKHLIMWDSIQAEHVWMSMQLPDVYRHRVITNIRSLTSEDLPYFNILAGLCLSVGLRHAGTGSSKVRDLLCTYLDQFMRMCRLPALSYDGNLARITVRNCQDVIALSASCVMAGTGDLVILRRLRSLHGRIDAETPYGSHIATHFAIGSLFLGGGTQSFGTSSLAVASLLCAFYPLFPASVLDNISHLQAFRHFWVLATERRCLLPRDIDTHRPLPIPVLLSHKDGTTSQQMAPCLIPDLSTINSVQTMAPEYWPITLSLSSNRNHLAAFIRHQSIFLRRRNAYDASRTSIFGATVRSLNDTQTAHQLRHQPFDWIFTLPSFQGLDRAERALVLPSELSVGPAGLVMGTRGTVVDDRLVLETACLGDGRSERLWNLRILLKWAEGCKARGEVVPWLGQEMVEGLRTRLVLWGKEMMRE